MYRFSRKYYDSVILFLSNLKTMNQFINNLKSRYIAVKHGAHIEQLINERDFIEILRTDKIVIYQINY